MKPVLKGDALQSPCPHLLKLKGNKTPNLLHPPPSMPAHHHHLHLLHSPWPRTLLPPTCKQLHGLTLLLPTALQWKGVALQVLSSSLSADPFFVGILRGTAFPSLLHMAGHPPASACSQERERGSPAAGDGQRWVSEHRWWEAGLHVPSPGPFLPALSWAGKSFSGHPPKAPAGMLQLLVREGARRGWWWHICSDMLPESNNPWGQLPLQWEKAQSTAAAEVAISHLTPTTGCRIFEERNSTCRVVLNNGMSV